MRIRQVRRRVGIWAVAAVSAGCGNGTTGDTAASSAPLRPALTEVAGRTGAPVVTRPRGSTVETTAGAASTAGRSAELAGPGAACADGARPAVFAYDIRTGASRWARCVDDSSQRFLQAASDDIAYVIEQPVNEDGSIVEHRVLLALDAASGTERWRREVASFPVPGHFLAAGVIVVPVENGTAIAGLDATTGTDVWRLELEGMMRAVAVTATTVLVEDIARSDDGFVTLATDAEGQPVLPSMTFRLNGHDRTTGSLMWSVELPQPADQSVAMGAAVDGDTAVIAPGPYAVDAVSGELLWSAEEPTVIGPLGAAIDGVVLTGTLNEPTTAVDLATGRELWTNPGSAPYAGSFAVGDGAVFVSDRMNLIAYDLETGEERWRLVNDPDDYSWPWHASDDTLFTMWWNLEARSTTDGSLKWSTKYPVGDVPTGPTPRMISIVTNTTSAIVTFYDGTLGGD